MKKVITLLYFIVSLSILGCSSSEQNYILDSGEYCLEIDRDRVALSLSGEQGITIISTDTLSGLLINKRPILSTTLVDKTDSSVTLECVTADREKVEVTISHLKGRVEVAVNSSNNPIDISFRTAAGSVAHGLGDAGAFGESYNLLENSQKIYPIVNNGGTLRWLSTFTIFPYEGYAGVFFTPGEKRVVLDRQLYSMEIDQVKEAKFYLLTGDIKDIYSEYRSLREEKGFQDIEPKSRLFELGWESWDALGWNTNQTTVREILDRYKREGYPIRWAVTGSGFWDEGGTTTSFGRWGDKFSDSDAFREWMHSQDIKWMIGLRTNIIPKGGPYYPKTKKRDKNLKVRSFYGNNISEEAEEKGYFLKDANGETLSITSTIFPIVPCNIIDGNVAGAAEWFQQSYAEWNVDGIKEDTMMDLKGETTIFNRPIAAIANRGGLVMARCGNFSAPGTLLRINDTGVGNIHQRLPINYMQYAASGCPNVYSDVAGVHNMHNVADADRSLRHTWLLSLTAGMAVGASPSKWSEQYQNIFKKAIDFHYELGPYLYSAAVESYNSGFPYTLTPLSIAYPDDGKSMTENFQWMIGRSIMAAPLLNKEYKSNKQDIYLPEGIWYDWETGERFKGGVTLEDYSIPLDKTPCFVGGEGIVLLRNSDESLYARVYNMEQESSTTFSSIEGDKSYTIQLSKYDLDSMVVWDSSSNSATPFTVKESYISFKVVEGHDYIIK